MHWTANQNSPLLNLPAEIRNRIYNYALGGNVLHIYIRQGDHRISNIVCRAQRSDDDVTDEYKHYETQASAESFTRRHTTCIPPDTLSPDGGSRLSVSLLRTCAQIYNEAADLPYTSNMFSLSTTFSPNRSKTPYSDSAVWCHPLFDHFMNHRTPRQKNAIRSIILAVSAYETPDAHERKYFRAKMSNVLALTNLNSITLLVENWRYELESQLRYWGDSMHHYKGHLCDFLRFGRNPSLKSVKLCMFQPGKIMDVGVVPICKRIENEILEECALHAQQKDSKGGEKRNTTSKAKSVSKTTPKNKTVA